MVETVDCGSCAFHAGTGERMTVVELARSQSGPSLAREGAFGRGPLPRPARVLIKSFLLGALVLVVVWTGLLPRQLGGSMSYVIANGISMLPRYRAGDLVILRQEPSYHVGEVAAFHNQ